MNQDEIEQHITIVANALFHDMIKEEIIKAYTDVGWSQDDIQLIVIAGEQLCQDRKNATPIKPVFRRI